MLCGCFAPYIALCLFSQYRGSTNVNKKLTPAESKNGTKK